MNIKILDSWLREHLKTDAEPKEIAEKLSLTSVSIERVEKYNNDFLYDIEVTTNRPDLASVIGLAREAAAVLPQFGINAEFIPPVLEKPDVSEKSEPISIVNDPKLVNRVLGVVMEVTVKESPQYVKDRLESSDIRSLNNIIDVTNYVMRTIGHPAHVFDFDRLATDKLVIREANPGEKVTTLDKREHTLHGGDIIAVDGKGRIVDLLGVMGLDNSVVTDSTKRIFLFLDNNDPNQMRKTSMTLGIRTDAVQMNEKGLDPELAYDALLYGIQLYKEIAEGKIISDITDIYPNKLTTKPIIVSLAKVNDVIGITLSKEKVTEILKKLGFSVEIAEDTLNVTAPSFRLHDVSIEEDIIEEIARVYGYHNIPNVLPPLRTVEPKNLEHDEFYWEARIKNAMKYWGFTEVYTYSMVADWMYEGELTDAVTIHNPLTEDGVYMRNTLIESLLQLVAQNKNRDTLHIFEIANIYLKDGDKLPIERRMFSGIVKKPDMSFFTVKGLIEQILSDSGVKEFRFKKHEGGGIGADIYIGEEKLGEIEMLDNNLIDFELDFELLIKHATLRKTYTPLTKYPPIIEDLALKVPDTILTGDIIELIKTQNSLITEVSLLDKFSDTRTFHIIYQDKERNLTSEEVGKIREKILIELRSKLNVTIKTP